MAKITREELLKIARISSIDIHEDEIESLCNQLDSILSYAQRVQEIGADVTEEPHKIFNSNVFRDDIVIRTDPQPILAQAPSREEDYFVVPKILETPTDL